jgi:membrane-bound serine protease (ClpP class)
LGIGGAISLALGSLLLFDTETSDLVVDRSIVFTTVFTLSALMIVVGYLVFKSQRRKPTLGLEGLVGEVGEVRAALSPVGKVFVHGEYWNAEGDGEIPVGEKVRVTGFDGMCLKVQRLSR